MSKVSPKDSPNTTRRKSRELAVQVLFQKEFSQEVNVEASLNYFRETLTGPEAMWAYAADLILGTLENLSHIDEKLSGVSKNWSLSRMSSVDLNILRVAVYEIEFKKHDVPPKVVINEAIEIGKKYGTAESGAFINGILNEFINK